MLSLAPEPQPKAPLLLPGYVTTVYVNRNGRRYGPYHVRRWKAGNKLHREYIKPADLQRVRAACQAAKQSRQRGAEISRSCSLMIGNLNWMERMCKREEKGTLTPEDRDFADRLSAEGYDIPGRPKLRARSHFSALMPLMRSLQILNRSLKKGFMVPQF